MKTPNPRALSVWPSSCIPTNPRFDSTLESGDTENRVPLEGRYANFFRVGQNAYEVIIEFGQLYQAEHSPRIHSRIVTSPAYARELLRTLEQALEQHEEPPQLKDSEG